MNKLIVQAVEKVCEEVIANYYSMNLQASKQFGNETVTVDYGSGVRIESPSHVYQMEEGRAAGTMPPVSVIRQWIRDKNANAGTDIPEEAAYAIAYTIKRDGIRVPNPHNSGGVVSSIISPSLIDRLAIEVNNIVRAEILTILTK